jgi:hypothetical protein
MPGATALDADSAQTGIRQLRLGTNLAADSTAKVLGHVIAVASRSTPGERRRDKLNQMCWRSRLRGGDANP